LRYAAPVSEKGGEEKGGEEKGGEEKGGEERIGRADGRAVADKLVFMPGRAFGLAGEVGAH
jgi:hypothetical protein